ncbi:MAG: PadR family transcriptional regulator [Candidatus Thermoplasmatota archaeon]|nr:PadR family transcriptional regulator [Candidatus Thermoplasmatota archaeon]
MATIFNFQTKSGKQRGILAVYILHSLHKKPKSGYDILKEITEKTHGTWTPSKGTLYPLLTKLEKDNLIQINKVEQRSKTVYETTEKGIEQLNNIRKHAKEMEEKINQFRNMLSEIINEEKSEIISTMLQIRKLVIELSQTKQEKIQKMLNKTLNELQDLAQEEGIPVE